MNCFKSDHCCFLALFLAMSLQGFTNPVSAQEAAEGEEPTTLEEAAVAIPAEEITVRVEETRAFFREIQSEMGSDFPLLTIQERIPETERTLAALTAETETLLGTRVTEGALLDLRTEWLREAARLETWQQSLTERTAQLNEDLAALRQVPRVWEATREEVIREGLPPEILDRVVTLLTALAELEPQLVNRRGELLRLQHRVTELQGQSRTWLQAIEVASGELRMRLFNLEERPLWAAVIGAESDERIPEQLGGTFRRNVQSLARYSDLAWQRFLLHLAFFLAAFVLFVTLGSRARELVREDKSLRTVADVLARPASAALLVALFLNPWLHAQSPRAWQTLVGLLLIVPLVRLLPGQVTARMRPGVYVLGVIYLVGSTIDFLPPNSLSSRLLLLLVTLLSAGALIWLVRTLRQDRLQGESRWLNIAFRAGQFGIGALVLSVAANLVGNVSLARLLTERILVPVYLAVVVRAASLLLEGVIVIVLRTDAARKLAMVRNHGPLVRRRLLQLLRVAAVVTWVLVSLSASSLLRPLVSLLSTLLGASIQVGTIAIAVGDIVALGVVVWLSFVVSRFVRFILDEDILPRMPLPRGAAAAVSKTAHYVILLVGFFLAINAAGIDLSRFVILAGALGVGVGFGLQNVVNNFVSGLILLFERPIQVGDLVQVGDLTGEVRHIGIRATIVRTREGSEVIVPNANLVSNEVINWTLSDPRRRINVPVGVAYGTDPERVMDLLLRAAREHSDILEHPAPTTLFLGFGESSLDFSLRAWTAQSDTYTQVRSALTLAVNAALIEAGIEVPFPQRDLHVRSADSGAGELVAEPRSQEKGDKGIRKLPHR